MLTAAILLAGLAIALAWPVPIFLAGARWPARAPATALVLWQAIALAGGLSMIGSLLTFGLIPFGEHLLDSWAAFTRSIGPGWLAPSVPFVYLFALSASALLGAHLVFNLVLTAVRIGRQRRRHRELVQLLSSPIPDRPGTRVLDLDMPVAYCLPGNRTSITVFSAGLVTLLDERQLQAVIQHEKAHLSQRHYLVLLAFDAWRTSLPWFPIATLAEREVALLIEMLADDRARTVADDATLAAAIGLVSRGGDCALDRVPGAGGRDPRPGAPRMPALRMPAPRTPAQRLRAERPPDTDARIERLSSGTRPLTAPVRLAVSAIAIALVAVPTLLLFVR